MFAIFNGDHQRKYAEARKIMDEALARQRDVIEQKCVELVASGINADEITIEHHPELETRIVVRGVPAASFRITVKE